MRTTHRQLAFALLPALLASAFQANPPQAPILGAHEIPYVLGWPGYARDASHNALAMTHSELYFY